MKWFEDAYYLRMPAGPPSQGDIWSGLPLLYHTTPQCSGVLITPRCDLSHVKTPVVNYLPIVSAEILLSSHGGFALLEAEVHRSRENLRQTAASLQVSDLLDIGTSHDRILDVLNRRLTDSPTEAAQEKLKTALTNFMEISSRLTKIENLLGQSGLDLTQLRSIIRAKDFETYQRDLFKNRFAEFHFLPPYEGFLQYPSVILIRHVTTCILEFINCAHSTRSQRDWDEIRKNKSGADFQASSTRPERLLRLKSPYLEALMARFSALFGRVGTRDFEESYLNAFVSAGASS